MAVVAWTELARRGFQRIVATIGRRVSARVARKWATKLLSAVAKLNDFPEIGSPVEDFPEAALRERIVGPYRVVYRYDGITCHILAVIRAEQDLQRVLPPGDIE